MIKSIFRLFNFKTMLILVLYLVFKNENKTIRAYEIKEESMKPALMPDEYVLSAKLKEAPKRGDVVIFTNTEKNIDVVKRVIGLPNENVSSSEGAIIINSEKIDDEWSQGLTDDFVSVELGNDEIFVLGDQRSISTSDSRTLGPIRYEDCWKLKVRYWPYQRFHTYE
ncbi:MAG: signal peptidase I [Candidatus Actinomarinales bacterium]|nr:MAG: signal peptidase I [Candidatus Actinomarinales bacterium]